MRFSCILMIVVAMVVMCAAALGQTEERLTLVGEAAPDFSLNTIDGKTFQLADFKGKSVVVLGISDPYG